MKPCACGEATESFYDVISHNGKVRTVPCCPKCFKKVRQGMRQSASGDYVHGQTLVRWFNREYKPMAHVKWLFFLAEKTGRQL